MPKRPRIAIPLGLDTGQLRAGRETAYLDAAYPEAIARAGGLPILVPVAADPALAMADADGLFLPGGDDFPPPRPYPAGVIFRPAPEPQRRFDAALLGHASRRGLPVLGVCYGMQLMALHAGGQLVYDLPSDRPSARPHQLPDPEARHPITLVADSRLARILGSGPRAVNSRHHQAVADPGQGMRACAHAEDGVIEALEALDDRFAIGVQWHPEDLSTPDGAALFEAFCAACGIGRPAAGEASD